MSHDLLVSNIRTVVPALWGLLITWALSQFGWLAEVFDLLGVDPTSKQTGAVVTTVAIALWYAFWRWLEGKGALPVNVVRVVLGSSRTPAYPARHGLVDQSRVAAAAGSPPFQPDAESRRDRIYGSGPKPSGYSDNI